MSRILLSEMRPVAEAVDNGLGALVKCVMNSWILGVKPQLED